MDLIVRDAHRTCFPKGFQQDRLFRDWFVCDLSRSVGKILDGCAGRPYIKAPRRALQLGAVALALRCLMIQYRISGDSCAFDYTVFLMSPVHYNIHIHKRHQEWPRLLAVPTNLVNGQRVSGQRGNFLIS